MSVRVQCPRCRKELSAPEELVGKKAVCPKCRHSFPVTAPPRDGDRPPPTPPPGPPKTEGERVERLGGSSREAGSKVLAGGGASPPDARPPAPPGASVAAAPPPAPPSPPPAKRVARTATFIAADATSTRLDLGADGQLPQLVLREDGKPESAEQEGDSGAPQSLRPLLLVALFCLSVCASVAMLLAPVASGPSETEAKAAARRQIQKFYIGAGPKFQPYQLLLRQALQAHNQGDAETERRCYRQVLQDLHAEGRSQYVGLTGMVRGAPPSDEDLEKQLSLLLSRN